MNINETQPQETEPEPKTGQATYSPEDNKLRLYVGRVPRAEYERLRADGWTSTPKQSCDFVAVWTPSRRDTCLEYADLIEDEDQGPEDRAADRAERFGEYREKRTEEATGHADRYDAGPAAHGFQGQHRAERAASRHDRIAGHACDAWSKAEYWQRRTAGVIRHALYVASPGVRMGRIKTIEKELRAKVEFYEKATRLFDKAVALCDITDPQEQTARVRQFFGNVTSYRNYPHPDHPEERHSLYTHMTSERRRKISGKEALDLYLSDRTRPDVENNEWANHYKLRLAYENQMLEAQGGRAAFVEVIPGGFLGGRQIQKVNKSTATGRVVSVAVWGTSTHYTQESGYKERGTVACLVTVETERLPADAYRAPTEEELAAFHAEKKAAKAAAPKADPCPLVNPTDEDAERLQELWNERAKDRHAERKGHGDFIPSKLLRMTQAQYSQVSKGGAYASASTRGLCRDAELANLDSNLWSKERQERAERIGRPVCMVRHTSAADYGNGSPCRLIVLTDKPQKPLPREVWSVPAPVIETKPTPEGELFAL